MEPGDLINLIQGGGALGAACVLLWLVLTRRLITRGEFDKAEAANAKKDAALDAANDELRRQSATNARLVEGLMLQRQEAEDIRREDPRKRRPTDG